MLQHLINFCSIICQVVINGRLKTKQYFKLLALKVVAVAYERWSVTRGPKCSDLTWKFLVFWKASRLREVVTIGDSTVLTRFDFSFNLLQGFNHARSRNPAQVTQEKYLRSLPVL